MFCLGCGYDLHALMEHRCPECGRDFDPKVPGTYMIAPQLHTGAWRFAVLISAFVFSLQSIVASGWLGPFLLFIPLISIGIAVAVTLIKRPTIRK